MNIISTECPTVAKLAVLSVLNMSNRRVPPENDYHHRVKPMKITCACSKLLRHCYMMPILWKHPTAPDEGGGTRHRMIVLVSFKFTMVDGS